MTQEPLFLDSLYDALKAIVQHAGGPKAVGELLFPSKEPDAAGRELMNALNPARRETLDPEQVVHLLRIGRDVEFHAAKHYLDERTGYLKSTPADPDVEKAEAARAVESAAAALQRATAALERVTKGRR